MAQVSKKTGRKRKPEVAIIGAGLAGLSCAHELEKYGVEPEIYERNAFIGEQHPHVSAILEIIHRPVRDSVKYFQDLGIRIRPLNTVNTIIHNSPRKVTAIKGNFGYLFVRDKGPEDVKNQLYSQLSNTKIHFNVFGDYETLRRNYEHVVIANGTTDYTRELGVWKGWLNTYVKGAIVLGDFDPNTLIVWINKTYCKNGYAYLTPFNSKRASIAIVVTEINEQEADKYWELFLYTENIKYTIVQEFKLNHRAGYVYPHMVDKIYLAGDAGGVIDPFLGFGQFGSITMGVMSARSIVSGWDYDKLIKELTQKNLELHEFRRTFDGMTNTGYDILMSLVGLPGLKQLLYDTPLNVIKIGAPILKLLPRKK